MGTSTTGKVRLSTAGQLVSCRAITGCVDITATDVVLQDVTVTCTSGKQGEAANGTGAVVVGTGASATISHATINGMSGVHACVWHNGVRLGVVAINCSGINDGVFSWTPGGNGGHNVSVRDSYFHDFTTKTANGHIDGYQTEGASHVVIDHNTYLMTSDSPGGDNDTDSAIAIWNSMANSTDFTVSDNLIAGGGFSVYAEDYSPSESSPSGGYTVTDVHFNDNVFSTRLFSCVGSYGVWFPRGAPSDGWHRSGNRVLETGQIIDSANPTANGHTCN
jgi:hypothetical protein